MLSDRFAVEFIYIITQSVVDPAFQMPVNVGDSTNKKVSMFRTHLEVKGRVHVVKSLALFKGKVLKEC